MLGWKRVRSLVGECLGISEVGRFGFKLGCEIDLVGFLDKLWFFWD